MTNIREINAITFCTMKHEVESLKSELRALRIGHLSTSEVRLPWTPEEKHRHEVSGHAEHDNRFEICVKPNGIFRHTRRVYSESCAFDCASVTFKESDGYVAVLTGRGPRCECFCRVVPRKGQRFKEFAVMRARYSSLQVRSDNEEALKHMLKEACEQVHLEYSTTRLETLASNGRGENSVRAMKEMVQRQRRVYQHVGYCVLYQTSIKHPLFALLVRHSEWILNHLVRMIFCLLTIVWSRLLRMRVTLRSTSVLNRILVGRRDDDDKQPHFSKHGFWV